MPWPFLNPNWKTTPTPRATKAPKNARPVLIPGLRAPSDLYATIAPRRCASFDLKPNIDGPIPPTPSLGVIRLVPRYCCHKYKIFRTARLWLAVAYCETLALITSGCQTLAPPFFGDEPPVNPEAAAGKIILPKISTHHLPWQRQRPPWPQRYAPPQMPNNHIKFNAWDFNHDHRTDFLQEPRNQISWFDFDLDGVIDAFKKPEQTAPSQTNGYGK